MIRELGRGASGAVFEARDAEGTRAALKVLLPEWRNHDEVIERFVREARVLMRIRSPHVGQLLDVGNLDAAQGALPYLALEYLEGTDLGRLIETKGRVPYRQALTWCADACDGIAEAHALGVVHRDVKPSNVFLADAGLGVGSLVKVIDFGIAMGKEAVAGSRITSLRKIVGSPEYMSPEQMMAASDVDLRADVWSMGVLLYEVLAGDTPFRGKKSPVSLCQRHEQAPDAAPVAHRGGGPTGGRSRHPQVSAPAARGAVPVDDRTGPDRHRLNDDWLGWSTTKRLQPAVRAERAA